MFRNDKLKKKMELRFVRSGPTVTMLCVRLKSEIRNITPLKFGSTAIRFRSKIWSNYSLGALRIARYFFLFVSALSSLTRHSALWTTLPTKLLSEKITNGEFEYEKNILLEMNFENARCTYDTNMNRYVTKKKCESKT